MGNYALLHCVAVWRKGPIEALSPSFHLSSSLQLSPPFSISASIPASHISCELSPPAIFFPLDTTFFLPFPHFSPFSNLVHFLAFFPPQMFLTRPVSFRRLENAEAGSSLALRQWNTSKSKSTTSLTNFTHKNIARQTGHSSCRLHRIPRLG